LIQSCCSSIFWWKWW